MIGIYHVAHPIWFRPSVEAEANGTTFTYTLRVPIQLRRRATVFREPLVDQDLILDPYPLDRRREQPDRSPFNLRPELLPELRRQHLQAPRPY